MSLSPELVEKIERHGITIQSRNTNYSVVHSNSFDYCTSSSHATRQRYKIENDEYYLLYVTSYLSEINELYELYNRIDYKLDLVSYKLTICQFQMEATWKGNYCFVLFLLNLKEGYNLIPNFIENNEDVNGVLYKYVEKVKRINGLYGYRNNSMDEESLGNGLIY